MSSIIVSTEDFQDVLMVYLLDLLVHGSHSNNPLFEKFVSKMNGLGLKNVLLSNVLDMDAQNRVYYSIIKSGLRTGGRTVITITGNEKEEKE